ncbi:MAG: FMN-binding glutamate synthase family protein, partial [Duganella sp.]
MNLFSPRYLVFVAAVATLFAALALGAAWWIPAIAAALTVVGVSDLLQTKRALRRNYPILAH